jgi:aryl-alcohol dehydrogenase-like predicted oxidoreductase
MRYKLLGKSGLRVSELCLGAMTFGEAWDIGASYETCKKVFDTFSEAGGNFIDTAVNYQNGQSEQLVGDFIKADRDHFVVATKFTATSPDQTDPNEGGNNRKTLRQKVERSLKRLQVDYIDVLYVHVWDYLTPVEDVMRGLDDLIRAGKVLYVAISDTPAWVFTEANARADLMNWSRFIGVQLPYSLLNRDIERAEIPAAKHWDMAVLPWGALAGGMLTGKYDQTGSEPRRIKSVNLSDKELAVMAEVKAIADETGCSRSQVALNWVRQQQDRAVMIPIIGARTAVQLQDNLGCLDWTLSPEQVQRLSDVSRIDYGFSRDMVEKELGQYVYGKTFDLIDNHRGYPV